MENNCNCLTSIVAYLTITFLCQKCLYCYSVGVFFILTNILDIIQMHHQMHQSRSNLSWGVAHHHQPIDDKTISKVGTIWQCKNLDARREECLTGQVTRKKGKTIKRIFGMQYYYNILATKKATFSSVKIFLESSPVAIYYVVQWREIVARIIGVWVHLCPKKRSFAYTKIALEIPAAVVTRTS